MESIAYDDLSEIGKDLLRTNQSAAYGCLVVEGPGNESAAVTLQKCRPDELLNGNSADRQSTDLLMAGLWLWHDWLDESHRIAQGIETPHGSYWHAIMHRREGDFSNSKYWLARCRAHPAHACIATDLPSLISAYSSDPAVSKVAADGWDPRAFVDLAEMLHDHPDDLRHPIAVAIQRLEWRALFAHCLRLATA